MKIEFPRWRRESAPPTLPPWQRNIQHARLFLAEDVLRLGASVSGSEEETALVFRVATRVGNLSGAIREAYRQNRQLGGIFPAHLLISAEEGGDRIYYFTEEKELRRASLSTGKIPFIKRYDLRSAQPIPEVEWVRDHATRGRVIEKFLGLLPQRIIDGL